MSQLKARIELARHQRIQQFDSRLSVGVSV